MNDDDVGMPGEVFCFSCRLRMLEVLGTFYCGCRVISNDPMVNAQLEAGWMPCFDCHGAGCEHCGWLGTILPDRESEDDLS